MKYKVLSNLKKDGIDYSVGSIIELTEEEIQNLAGIVEEIEEKEEKQVKTPKRRGKRK